MAETVVIAGALAQKPGEGGHSWVPLQYALGFRRLGWNVLFVDVLQPDAAVDAAGRPCSVESSINLQYFLNVMRRFDLSDDFALICDGGARFIGRSREDVLACTRSAAFLLNIMGFVTRDDILGAASRRVFLDIDPGFGQMWRELGLADIFRGHDDFLTVGGNLGRPGCSIPTCGLSWIPTPPPVCCERWPVSEASIPARFTSVASWRGRFGPIEYHGRTFGLRVHEFRKFLDLPHRSGHEFQVALRIDAGDARDRTALADHDWDLIDPSEVAGDPWAYQAYIAGSNAEFSVAKNMYVATRSGWLSDRSVCYLASGKPVLTQDTGIGDVYPTGEGLLTFSTMEEAIDGVEELSGNYQRHARAARALAERHFDARLVVQRILRTLGLA